MDISPSDVSPPSSKSVQDQNYLPVNPSANEVMGAFVPIRRQKKAASHKEYAQEGKTPASFSEKRKVVTSGSRRKGMVPINSKRTKLGPQPQVNVHKEILLGNRCEAVGIGEQCQRAAREMGLSIPARHNYGPQL